MEEGIKGTERAEAGLDPVDERQVGSLDLAIPIIKRSISLLRRLRERADASGPPKVDDRADGVPRLFRSSIFGF